MVLQHLSRVKFGINHFFHGPKMVGVVFGLINGGDLKEFPL